ncbi:MAG: hypothetical protein GF317_00695 [Candidatus Lokiarchaeota archaeon]|nr:hypothetical protein [Candidatus Lokiarchaeota archaeon]MBD3198487.1 hypothetical protein [Candidatus Lokiarchaeota archaeon]
MIGDYKGTVANKVVTALLQAYLDILDYDGMKSILREANMLDIKNQREIDPNQTIDFFSFKKIIAAQNCLLYECTDLLFEIGRKFSFYLYPFGKSFQESIEDITELIDTQWDVKIVKSSKKEVRVEVENCVFCSEIGVTCDLFVGFLVHTLEKTLTSQQKVEYKGKVKNPQDPKHNYFTAILKIRKNK